jgi:hypothetical protein
MIQLFRKKNIYGCDARGDADSVYLTRYIIFKTDLISIYLHIFHRSDADDLHDHPWPFLGLILWRGYNEQTPQGKRRFWPGMVLFRPASWSHRVELVNGKRAATLVIVGKRIREWGFFTSSGWVKWTNYFRKMGCEE